MKGIGSDEKWTGSSEGKTCGEVGRGRGRE